MQQAAAARACFYRVYVVAIALNATLQARFDRPSLADLQELGAVRAQRRSVWLNTREDNVER
ncbi:hypothetical protein ATB98_08965 [Sinorhizobium saheli]|uniref:Uncharacterized protein n=1 Tax=Sinorhizobium saheli TaxID=36856 RepID=A0A178YRH2_SINSA|nr:hypothetical protein ATB98_08965 [Sinorhizobium saheli]